MHILKFTNNKKNEKNKNIIYFLKSELLMLLNLYSKQVSMGFCKDYAIDNINNYAIFSIFKHTHDLPIFQIQKFNKSGNKNNSEFILSNSSKIIEKGKSLEKLLDRLEKKISLIKQK